MTGPVRARGIHVIVYPARRHEDGREGLLVHEIRQATADRVPAICGMLARAFADDPIFDLLVPDRTNRSDAVQGFFERLDAPLAAMGLLWEIGDAVAAAAWIPPDAHEAWAEIDAATLPFVREISPDGGRGWEAMWGWVLERIPDEPLWLLDHIGVEPGSQGTGCGRALIEHGFRLAEADGVGTFLETAVPANVPYYENLGFHVVADGVTPLEGPRAWLMRRDP